MRLALRFFFPALLLAFVAVVPSARAQSDSRALAERMDRLEQELDTLRMQVYRAQGGSSVITSPALGGNAASSSSSSQGSRAISGDAYSTLDQRISSIEQQMQNLTGQVEKTSYAVNQLSAKLDRVQADNDVRFKELEQKAGIGGGNAASPSSSGDNNSNTNNSNSDKGAPPGSLLHPGSSSGGSASSAQTASTGPALVGKTPQEQYDYAFGMLRNSDYNGADRAFQAFVAQHPNDPLAGNAMYWLGQIPYSQGQWEQAAGLFLNAYKKYPKSAKASESLLKLGLAMSNLGKKKEACAAFIRFQSEYKDAADNLKKTAASEKSKLGC